jgi:hypothetical protein
MRELLTDGGGHYCELGLGSRLQYALRRKRWSGLPMNIVSAFTAGPSSPVMVFDAEVDGYRLAVAVVESLDGSSRLFGEGERARDILARHVKICYPRGVRHVVPVAADGSPGHRVRQMLRLLTKGPPVEVWALASSVMFVCEGKACYQTVLKIFAGAQHASIWLH